MSALPDPVPSPCTQVCRINERNGWCEGCVRTLDEIAAWSLMSENDKRAVWNALAVRRAALAERTST